jgi:arylformamidase
MMRIYKEYDQASLDRQYNARATIPDFQQIVEEWNRRSEQFRNGVSMFGDQRYGSGERELLDLFPAKENSPLLVFLHGGYWQAMDKRVFHFRGISSRRALLLPW